MGRALIPYLMSIAKLKIIDFTYINLSTVVDDKIGYVSNGISE